VYKARDPRLDRLVAIKVLPPDLTRDGTAKQRFVLEAKAASALDHPNICTIHEINETPDGQLYLVMAHWNVRLTCSVTRCRSSATTLCCIRLWEWPIGSTPISASGPPRGTCSKRKSVLRRRFG
jgi:hypothetical protein